MNPRSLLKRLDEIGNSLAQILHSSCAALTESQRGFGFIMTTHHDEIKAPLQQPGFGRDVAKELGI
jgi:hypothetical protein